MVASPTEPPLELSLSLDDAKTLLANVRGALDPGRDPRKDVYLGSPPGCFIEVTTHQLSRRVTLAVERKAPAGVGVLWGEAPARIAITLDLDGARVFAGSLRYLLKICQWAEWGGDDQPAGWSLGPMGTWTRIEATPSATAAIHPSDHGLIADQSEPGYTKLSAGPSRDTSHPSVPAKVLPNKAVGDVEKERPASSLVARLAAAILPVVVGALQVGAIVVVLTNLGGTMDFLRGVPVLGAIVDIPGAIISAMVALNVLAGVMAFATVVACGAIFSLAHRLGARK